MIGFMMLVFSSFNFQLPFQLQKAQQMPKGSQTLPLLFSLLFTLGQIRNQGGMLSSSSHFYLNNSSQLDGTCPLAGISLTSITDQAKLLDGQTTSP